MSVLEEGVDTIIYAGEISRYGYEELTKVCENAGNKCKKVNLILYTYGGDPHAAFRIARALQHHYVDGITLFIPHFCKSAGTLIAIGASELVISDKGELGPLDVQLIKPNEMFERSSGMDLSQGIEALRAQAIETFKNFVYEMRVGNKLSTKIATKVATEMTTGLFSPIFAQIDPSRIGEIQRATYIAHHYGNMLAIKSNNIKEDGVSRLVLGYPSHSFVIDRKEARDIFKKVRYPDEAEVSLLTAVDSVMSGRLDSSSVICFQWQNNKHEQEESQNDQSDQSSNDDVSTAKRVSRGGQKGNRKPKQSSKEPGTITNNDSSKDNEESRETLPN